ncbi:MAG: tRNA pseudouridine(55) synthase TruB [Burkholderiaceae bacterium]|nr:tRNA pseudouridine(55) synthase TruB [Burkholderiaceae bacterium]
MNPPVKRKRVPVHGVLLLDKPAGMSSTQALAKAKWLLNAEKAGHTGTLDPFATGLLPLCFGEATKFAQDLLEADKTYEAVVRLGITTATGDTEGEVIDTRPAEVTREQVEAVIATFRGPIRQVPPMHSALKRDGKPLYEYARAGITLEREAREVVIHSLELTAIALPEITLRVTCSKGTYVRVLGEDIGAALGCGAHLRALRRTGIDTLALSSATTLEALASLADGERAASLLPVDSLLSSFPRLELDAELARRFRQGQRIALGRAGIVAPCREGRVRVVGPDGGLLGTGMLAEDALLRPERLMATIPTH